MKSQDRERESDKSEKILPTITRVRKSGSEGLVAIALIRNLLRDHIVHGCDVVRCDGIKAHVSR